MKESFLKAVNNLEQYYVSDIIYAEAMTKRTVSFNPCAFTGRIWI